MPVGQAQLFHPPAQRFLEPLAFGDVAVGLQNELPLSLRQRDLDAVHHDLAAVLGAVNELTDPTTVALECLVQGCLCGRVLGEQLRSAASQRFLPAEPVEKLRAVIPVLDRAVHPADEDRLV